MTNYKTLQQLFQDRNRLFKEMLHGSYCTKEHEEKYPIVKEGEVVIDPQKLESFNQETQQLAVEWLLEQVGEDEETKPSEQLPLYHASLIGRNEEKARIRSLLKQIIT